MKHHAKFLSLASCEREHALSGSEVLRNKEKPVLPAAPFIPGASPAPLDQIELSASVREFVGLSILDSAAERGA